jgi:hypothetical protein
MQQYPLDVVFFNDLNGFRDSCARTSPHGPGYCYTGPTVGLLDNNHGFIRPSGAILDVCLSAQNDSVGNSVSGNVIVQLYAVDMFNKVNATQLEQSSGYRVIAQRTMALNGEQPQHGFITGGPGTSLTTSELDALALAASSNTGGIRFGLRFWNDPSCPAASALKLIQWSGRLALGPA